MIGNFFICFLISKRSWFVILVLLFVWWGFLWIKLRFFDKLVKWKFGFVGKKICVSFMVLMFGIFKLGSLYCMSLWFKKL